MLSNIPNVIFCASMNFLVDDGGIYSLSPLQASIEMFTGRGPGGAGGHACARGYLGRASGVYPGLCRLQSSLPLVASMMMKLPQMIRMGVFKHWRRSMNYV